MSIQPHATYAIPEDTGRIARAAFPKGNLYMRMRDELGELYQDSQFAELFPGRGQPAQSPGRLAWVTVMQFSEGLSDRQAADAVRGRIDWKYVLGLELADAGFDYSILSEFRGRLAAGQREQVLLDQLIEALKQRGLLKAREQQRTDSTHILAMVRQLNRVEFVGEVMRQALNELAEVAPEWLKGVSPADWFTRYGRRFDQLRLPKDQSTREKLIEVIGMDGLTLLEAVRTAPGRQELSQLQGVEILRQVWLQQYWTEVQEDGRCQVHARSEENQPPCEKRLQSPYDLEARFSIKRKTEWMGYKTHLTETCEKDEIHLITHVETTLATTQDVDMTASIHTALKEKALLPDKHLVDGGYVDAENLVTAKQTFGLELCGPVKKDVRWQAHAGEGFDLSHFQVDWPAKRVTCPGGQTSQSWYEQVNAYLHPVIQVRFATATCRACAHQAKCTRDKQGRRTLILLPQAEHLAIQQRRVEQETPEFRETYAQRSGIEGTLSQGIRGFEMRRSRYVGLAKTHLQMLATATAINLHRLFDWWQDKPRARTRVSPFAGLAPELVPVASWGSA